ncbi:MAG: cytochrome c-type biogenesis protein CcmH [Candidatus Binataceae bacterium]
MLMLAMMVTVSMAATVMAHAAAVAKTSEHAVAESLTCQCGCGLTVANCNHPNCEFSVPMRGKIDTMIARGMGRPEIIAFFRKQYGEKILSAPTTQGFNILAWVMPFAAIIAGGGIIAFTVGRWRKASDASSAASGSAPVSGDTAPPAEEPSAYDAELRRKLERELKERL